MFWYNGITPMTKQEQERAIRKQEFVAKALRASGRSITLDDQLRASLGMHCATPPEHKPVYGVHEVAPTYK